MAVCNLTSLPCTDTHVRGKLECLEPNVKASIVNRTCDSRDVSMAPGEQASARAHVTIKLHLPFER